MATIQKQYGTPIAVTITLASLNNGSAQQSDEIDDGASGDRDDIDYLLRIQTAGDTGGTGPLNIYVAAQLGDGIRAGSVGATDASFTGQLAELKFWDSVTLNAATAVIYVTRSLASVFHGEVPPRFVLVVENASGAALSATGADHDLDLLPIKLETV